MTSSSSLVDIARRWIAAWNARDLEALVALYADDARHTSPKLRTLRPDTGGYLRGRDELRAWFADAMQRLPELRYLDARFTADGARVFMEYRRAVPGEPDLAVAEVLEIADGSIVASRVYHG